MGVDDEPAESLEDALRQTFDGYSGIQVFAGPWRQTEPIRIACARARAAEARDLTADATRIPIRVCLPLGADGHDPVFEVDLAHVLLEAIEDESIERSAVVAALLALSDRIKNSK